MNLGFIMECELHVCFSKAHETAPPLRMKTHPNIDLLLLVLVIQQASVYPSSFIEKLL